MHLFKNSGSVANKLKRHELRRIRKKYRACGIIKDIIDTLKNNGNVSGRISYDCVELETAFDMLFYFHEKGFDAKFDSTGIACISISWKPQLKTK